MRLDLYLRETVVIARQQTSMLEEARSRLLNNQPLSRLEQHGVLHALQILLENAIGKAKHILKACGEPVPVSAYDCFSTLSLRDTQIAADLPAWNAAIGLRNRIVLDYMNIDMNQVLLLVRDEKYLFIATFLTDPFLTFS